MLKNTRRFIVLGRVLSNRSCTRLFLMDLLKLERLNSTTLAVNYGNRSVVIVRLFWRQWRAASVIGYSSCRECVSFSRFLLILRLCLACVWYWIRPILNLASKLSTKGCFVK